MSETPEPIEKAVEKLKSFPAWIQWAIAIFGVFIIIAVIAYIVYKKVKSQ